MKKIWTKMVFLAAGVLALLGIQPSWAALTPPTPKINHIKENTPLYLKHSLDRVSQSEAETQLAWRHYQHYSHRAHYSHWAHNSHHAHYSHYNHYR
jgi:hypothetical protein